MSKALTYKISLLLPVVTGVVGFLMGRQFSSAPVIPAAMAAVGNSGSGSTEVKQVKPELDGEYAAWATKVEQAEAGELKEIYDNVKVTFPEAGSSVLTAARAFVLECWAGKDSRSLIKAVFAEEDPLEPEEVGTALARWNARDALQLIVQTMTAESEEDAEREDWQVLLHSTVGEWARLHPEELLGMIGPLQPPYLQIGIGCALEVISKTNAALAASKFDRWLRSGQMTAVQEIVHELIAAIARNYYQQNAVAAREWISAISARGLKDFAAQTFYLCLAGQEGEALATELTRADPIARSLLDLPMLLKANAYRPNASLISGLNLIQAMATRVPGLQEQNPPSRKGPLSSLGGGPLQYPEISITYQHGGRSNVARSFAGYYARSHGGDPGFWAKFASEVSALPAEWSAECSNLVETAFEDAEPHWEADPLAALKATASLPQACQARAISQLLTGLQKVDPAAVTRFLAALPSEQLASLPPIWQLRMALGSAAPTTPINDVDDLIAQMSGPSPEIEKFVVERGTGEMAYVRTLAHANGIEAAAQWATTLAPARGPNVVSSAVHLWAYLDDDAAAAWVMTLPVGPLRAAGATSMAASLAPYDREASRAWTAKAKESP